MSRNQKIQIIGIGIIFSIILCSLSFLSWNGIEPNNEKTNLINGIPEMLNRNKIFPSLICVLIGVLPVILTLNFLNQNSENKILILTISLLTFIIQVLGIWAIHIEFMIYNYGKVNWTLSFGYYMYLITQIGIGILNIYLFGNLIMKGKFIAQNRKT